MKSRLLNIRNEHHIEESQLEQMLSRHQDRAMDHVSFLISPPCFATNFMSMTKFELTSTADEAQGSTSRTVAGEKGAECRELPLGANAAGMFGNSHQINTPSLSNEHSAPDFSILYRPHIVKSKEERHQEFCAAECGRVASGICESCDAPVCSAHRYGTNGHHDPNGMCGKCYDESIINGARA